MRPTYRIDDLLGTRSGLAVLRVLHGVHVPLNASQIAARTGLTRPAVATVLGSLVDMGVVHSASAGRAIIHWLVRDNVYVERIIDPLFRAEESIPQAMLEDLRRRFCGCAESVVLFGSYARGDQSADSDVDVVLVGADVHAKEELDAAATDGGAEFRDRFGASLSAITYTREEAGRLAIASPALAESLQTDGVVVCGISPWEWSSRAPQ